MTATSDEIASEPQIRRLSLADLPAIMAIERDSFATPWRDATFQGLLLRQDSDLIGAFRTGRLVGYAVCWTVGDQAELGNVAVTPEERRKGTGRRLVEAALDRVRLRGARECFLEVRESNANAQALYQRCGFTEIGRRRNYYTKPVEDALVMRATLL
jgi:[ribosomal protein S18]-alanine N-acetyltransferase